VAIPNVEGRTLDDAKQLLSASGFQFEEITELSEVAEGLVIRTEPSADELVSQQQVVRLVVSGGPEQISVPATLIGDPLDVARDLLESDAYGLVVQVIEEVDENIPAGVVIRTNPQPNTLVDRGSTIELIISSGPGQVIVPPLVGLSEGEARNLIADRGLEVEVSRQELAPGDSRDGTVLEQSIDQGQQVDRGTLIQVVVGEARAPETTTTTTTTTSTTTTTVPESSTTVATTTTPADTTEPPPDDGG